MNAGLVKDMNGLERINAERFRQVGEEGWSLEHDDQHTKGEILAAAECYAIAGDAIALGGAISGDVPDAWPWDASWWKPVTDPVRMWTKAGALYRAEADRLRRIHLHVSAGKMEAFANECASKIDRRLAGVPEETPLPPLIPSSFRLPWSRYGLDNGHPQSRVEVVATAFREETGEPFSWAVREGAMVLNRTGEWEQEPNPSSRSMDFLSRARWGSVEEAAAAATAYFTKNEEVAA